jgi:signal transduction histidine kinase
MRIWPRTLFGRVALIVGTGLAVAHGMTLIFILFERVDLGLTTMKAYLGRDVAASVTILERVPVAERPAWLPTLARQNYRYSLSDQPPGTMPATNRLVMPLTESVKGALGASRVGSMSELRSGHHLIMYLPLTLSDGSRLTLELTPPMPMFSSTAAILLALQLIALGTATWFAVRLTVRPVAQLAQAANALTPGSGPLPFKATGPQEVVAAARAFQAMQARIDHQLAERLHLLAAISHDLQTPITRMRLRAEQIPDTPLQDKLLADLQNMQYLVDEGLAYAKTAHAAQEAERTVDVMALIDGVVCDATDSGHTVTLDGQHAQPLVTRMHALRRVLTNLVDNAIKFGQRADIVVTETAAELSIAILDQGPGISEEHLKKVFEPFFRVEASRNRETGGTGLGLAIAQQLTTTALNGHLTLSNRPGGGLEARLALPRR